MSANIRKLEAPDGYVYVNGEFSGKVIYLGKNDKEEHWLLTQEANCVEITAEDALEILLGGAV